MIAGFSRVGLTIRSRLLPEFTAAPPPAAGRIVLITGATSGIGHAAAVALASQGAPCTSWPATVPGRSDIGGHGG
ncbi:MAG TPA: hypothetical protein VFJ07_08915 [Streptosporangiaceae bacterium]|nr:hypothetical protein [Streptosporangiaceae bacterium]